jgi:hypothetical protein
MLNGISSFEWKSMKNLVNSSSSCSPESSGIQSLAAVYAKSVEKNTLEPL